jgi:uncharacterized protein YbjT (DUF2867 family)
MKVAVVGSTGRVGKYVAQALVAGGHEAVEISRARGIDVVTGDGLQQALSGVEAIVDAASPPSPDEEQATEFFTAAARNLQRYGSRAGAQRLVVVSIIGTDRFVSGYGVAKVVHEQLSLAGPIPARILRAAQFHEFVEQLMDWGTQGDVTYLPNMRTQLVAAKTVGDALAQLATGPGWDSLPAITELAGPREERLPEMAMLLTGRRGEARKIEVAGEGSDPNLEVHESGALLPGPQATLAGPTFEEWLDTAA